MAWQYRVELGDLYEAYEQDKLTIRQLADQFAARLRATACPGINPRADAIVAATTEAEFDAALETLYNFADRGRRLWINTFATAN